VNRTDAFFYDGLVLSIQRRDVTPERLIALTPRIGVPAYTTPPLSALRKPAMMLKSVVFPAPFGPISAVIEPGRTAKLA
jgi:hypothetical protein